jgi:hypothetical protein
VGGIHDTLVAVYDAQIPPFDDGDEGSPFHDFIGQGPRMGPAYIMSISRRVRPFGGAGPGAPDSAIARRACGLPGCTRGNAEHQAVVGQGRSVAYS